jgi:hypothetical protein
MRRKLGRNEIARKAHFLKGGPTEKTGRTRRKARRQGDRLEEKQALQQFQDEKSSED